MSVAGIAAVNFVAETKVVVRPNPPHCTTESATKPLPVTVSVNAAAPGVRDVGLMLVITGAGASLTVKVRATEAPPPGVGLKTVTGTVPADAMSVVCTVAFNWVEETRVVERPVPFHCTTELELKPVPFMVSVNGALAVRTVAGLMLVVAGTGLLNVRVWALEMPPTGTGVDTVIWALPADAMSVAGIAAVNFVAETKVVVRPDPPHCTTESATKPLPVTVSVNAAAPGVRDVGLMLVITGAGASLTVKVRATEAPPPGVGLKTVTGTVPADAMSVVCTVAFNWVEETRVVERPVPFHCTTELELKPVPFMVSVNGALAVRTVAGLMLVVVGSGLLNVRVWALEVPPTGTGVDTVIWALPADAMSVAGIAAVNFVAETKVVVRPDPPHCTTESATKPLPVTVSVNAAAPGARDVGLMLVITGAGASLTVKVRATEAPPPGVGLKTVTGTVPADAMSVVCTVAFNWVEETKSSKGQSRSIAPPSWS